MKLGIAGVACAMLASTTAYAEVRALTRVDVIRLAAAAGPGLAAARARVDEARAARAGATPWLAENPVLSGGAGPRWTGDVVVPQVEVALEQGFALGGGRGARLDAVRAGVDRARADAADVERSVVAEALQAWAIALHAKAATALAVDTERVATAVVGIAERREAAGDASAIEVALARASVLRARAARRAAEAEGRAASGRLAAMLGITGEIAVEGDLAAAPSHPLEALLGAARRRPDVLALQAEVREAGARRREGDAEALPHVTLGVSYESDGGEDVALGTLALSLPFFDRGAANRATADARRRGAHRALAATQAFARIEIAGLLTAYDAHREARAEAARAVAALTVAEPLLVRAYEAGETPIADLLVLRREIVDARTDELDRALDLALARVRLEAAAGVLR